MVLYMKSLLRKLSRCQTEATLPHRCPLPEWTEIDRPASAVDPSPPAKSTRHRHVRRLWRADSAGDTAAAVHTPSSQSESLGPASYDEGMTSSSDGSACCSSRISSLPQQDAATSGLLSKMDLRHSPTSLQLQRRHLSSLRSVRSDGECSSLQSPPHPERRRQLRLLTPPRKARSTGLLVRTAAGNGAHLDPSHQPAAYTEPLLARQLPCTAGLTQPSLLRLPHLPHAGVPDVADTSAGNEQDGVCTTACV